MISVPVDLSYEKKRKVGILLDLVHIDVHKMLQALFNRSVGGHNLLNLRHEALDDAGENRMEEAVLGVVVIMQAGTGEP